MKITERRAARAALRDAERRYNRGLRLLGQGDYAAGWRLYEARLNMQPAQVNTVQPRWTGQPLRGETVLLHGEQGFGDTFMFCRYVPLVAAAGGAVLLAVPKASMRILAGLPGVASLRNAEDFLTESGRIIHYHSSLMSLPFVFGTTLETVPPPARLHADPAPWSDFLGGLAGLRVGLVWAGRAELPADKQRSMALADMAPLLSVPNCSFVSLQLGPAAKQMQALPPWYPSLRIYRQTVAGDWTGPVQAVAADLTEMAAAFRP